jgi:hypothetical protein
MAVILAANTGWAGPIEFQRQAIAIPAKTPGRQLCSFVDIDNDGRADLLVIDLAAGKLLVYGQRASGFGAAPDQAIDLPAQTAWVALCDVDEHPGLELLMSTATGLAYVRQNGGRFQSQPRTLIQARQVFANDGYAIRASLPAFKIATNEVIPVISADQAVTYQRTGAFEWKADPPIALPLRRTSWIETRGDWSAGSNPSRILTVEQIFQAKPDDNVVAEKKAENDAIKRIVEDMDKQAFWHEQGMDRADVNGDGRRDVVLWQISGDMEPKTDVFLFLRGPDGRLPELPTQVLHCRGLPLPVGPEHRISPVCDLKGDSTCELVLAALKTSITSSSSLVEMLFSRGLDWTFTIRPFKRGAFSGSSEASVGMSTMLPDETGAQEFFLIDGDFNADGRRDLLVRRSTTQWDVFLSSTNGTWFAPQAAWTFEVPVEGRIETGDLNGDGISDLFVQADNEPRLFVFLSRPARMKASHP